MAKRTAGRRIERRNGVALRAGRVDATRRRVRVEAAATDVGGRLEFGSPKTHEARTVIVPSYVIERMQPLLADRGSDQFVFTAPRGRPLRANNFRKRVFNRRRTDRDPRSCAARPPRHGRLSRHLRGGVDQSCGYRSVPGRGTRGVRARYGSVGLGVLPVALLKGVG